MAQAAAPEKKSTGFRQPDPSAIMQIGMGFWASKTLLAAVRFHLFTLLSARPSTVSALREKLGLQTTPRHVADWLDALVSLGFLEREGNGEAAVYSNAPDTDFFLDQNKPAYIGGILEMSNNRLYHHWADLEEGLITGKPQNESKHDKNMHFLGDLYKDPQKLHEFMDAMSGIQAGNFQALVRKFNFGQYHTVADIGGADGLLAVMIALEHPSVQVTVFDLPDVEPLANARIRRMGLEGKVIAKSGDFFKDPLPAADVMIMGNILHGCDEAGKMTLLRKVYDALPAGGAFIVVENIIDDDRRQNTFGLLMSLNMLIENGEAFDYSKADFDGWAKTAGFQRTEILPLTGPASALVAYK